MPLQFSHIQWSFFSEYWFWFFEIFFFWFNNSCFFFFFFTDAVSSLVIGSWIFIWHDFWIYNSLYQTIGDFSKKRRSRKKRIFEVSLLMVSDLKKIWFWRRNSNFFRNPNYIPSISMPMSTFISAAYSSGSSLRSGETNPLTIIVFASTSTIPRDIR